MNQFCSLLNHICPFLWNCTSAPSITMTKRVTKISVTFLDWFTIRVYLIDIELRAMTSLMYVTQHMYPFKQNGSWIVYKTDKQVNRCVDKRRKTDKHRGRKRGSKVAGRLRQWINRHSCTSFNYIPAESAF